MTVGWQVVTEQQLQRELTRMMRHLAQHRGMAHALDSCPDLLRQCASFMSRIVESLFAPAEQTLRTGRPHVGKGGRGGLLDLVDPSSLQPWCIDFLGLVGALSDAVCRRRDLRQGGEFATLTSGASEAAWPLRDRYDLYCKLKLWSSHGAGKGINQVEEIELNYRLSAEPDATRRRQLANALERGARRRLLYTHWAISQLMSVGPMLPLGELSEADLEAELAWAAEGEREAQFVLLRPLLVFHFDVLLPIFFVYCRSADTTLAALYQASLLMPVEVDAHDTCPAVHFVRMTATLAVSIDREHHRKREKLKSADTVRPPFVLAHERNVATVIVWGLLYLLSPEATYRKDAAAALYALAEGLAAITPPPPPQSASASVPLAEADAGMGSTRA